MSGGVSVGCFIYNFVIEFGIELKCKWLCFYCYTTDGLDSKSESGG